MRLEFLFLSAQINISLAERIRRPRHGRVHLPDGGVRDGVLVMPGPGRSELISSCLTVACMTPYHINSELVSLIQTERKQLASQAIHIQPTRTSVSGFCLTGQASLPESCFSPT